MKAKIVFYTELDNEWEAHDKYVFGTYDKDKAIEYCEKANNLIKKWKTYFTNLDWEDYDNIQDWQRQRADRIGNILHFGFKEIEMR